MDKCNSVKHDFHKKPNIYPNLNTNISNEQQFRLNKINEIKDYFLAEIKERELINKYISKYIASLDYFHKSLNVLSILSGSISIASFATVIGARNNWSKLWIYVFNYIRICKKKFKNNKKKHNNYVMLDRCKLNSI